MSTLRVSDIERAVSDRFPLVRAESWDRNGLLVGDPAAAVTGVVVALDPTVAVIEDAVARGANVVVTHHPAFLKAPEWLTPGRGSAGVVFSALSQGVALVNAHTNLDRDSAAQALLPDLLGYRAVKPVERRLAPQALVTVWVPHAAVDKVTSAMAGAGAGRIGDYRACNYASEGVGTFTAPADGSPHIGQAGETTALPEVRVEMICPSASVRGVVSAAASAHPYEEPLVAVGEVQIARNAARMGMVCEIGEPSTLAAVAAHAARVFGVIPRVWGAPDVHLSRVATATGSAGSLIADAIAAGAQALIAGEVRYHDALDAQAAGLSIIELGHDVTEWPMVRLLETTVRERVADSVEVHAMCPEPAWWTP